MTSRPWPPDGAGRRLPRRSLLILGAGLGIGLTGCTSGAPEPPAPSRSAASPTPEPMPLPGTVDGAALESSLVEVAAWISTTFAEDLDRTDQRLLDHLQLAHSQHAATLSSADPLKVDGPLPSSSSTAGSSPSGSPTASPSPTEQPPPPIDVGDDLDAAFAELATMETDVADGHRRLAIDPRSDQDQERAPLSLLWGSLAASCSRNAEACRQRRDPGKKVTGVQRVVVSLPEPVAAVQQLLEQTYAVIFGYQTAIAKLSGDRGEHARTRLRALRDLRDQLSVRLAAGDQKVPTSHAAYQFPVQPTDGAKATRLIGLLETGLQPYCGQWAASADDDARPDAVDSLITTALEAQYWTAKISIWPGWPIAD